MEASSSVDSASVSERSTAWRNRRSLSTPPPGRLSVSASHTSSCRDSAHCSRPSWWCVALSASSSVAQQRSAAPCTAGSAGGASASAASAGSPTASAGLKSGAGAGCGGTPRSRIPDTSANAVGAEEEYVGNTPPPSVCMKNCGGGDLAAASPLASHSSSHPRMPACGMCIAGVACPCLGWSWSPPPLSPLTHRCSPLLLRPPPRAPPPSLLPPRPSNSESIIT
jgi:hypothetical protein